jgi:predicted transcriptional regulator
VRRIILTVVVLLFLITGVLPNPGLFGLAAAKDAIVSGIVYDSITFDPISGANISLEEIPNGTMVNSTQTDSDGYFQLSNVSVGSYYVTYDAMGYHYDFEEIQLKEAEIKHLDIILVEYLYDTDGDGIPDSDERDDKVYAMAGESSSFYLCFQTLILVVIVLIISFIMYSKIKQENLLKNAQRKRILEYIKDNPGKHYRAILKDLDVPMGVLTYHINRLEKAQFLTSRQDGMYRRFYIRGPKAEVRFMLSNIQESILNVIKDNKGISQTKIAEKIGVSRKVVNYHVNILNQAGFIMVQSNGRESACYFVGS